MCPFPGSSQITCPSEILVAADSSSTAHITAVSSLRSLVNHNTTFGVLETKTTADRGLFKHSIDWTVRGSFSNNRFLEYIAVEWTLNDAIGFNCFNVQDPLLRTECENVIDTVSCTIRLLVYTSK